MESAAADRGAGSVTGDRGEGGRDGSRVEANESVRGATDVENGGAKEGGEEDGGDQAQGSDVERRRVVLTEEHKDLIVMHFPWNKKWKTMPEDKRPFEHKRPE
jgi:hypothetical protein